MTNFEVFLINHTERISFSAMVAFATPSLVYRPFSLPGKERATADADGGSEGEKSSVVVSSVGACCISRGKESRQTTSEKSRQNPQEPDSELVASKIGTVGRNLGKKTITQQPERFSAPLAPCGTPLGLRRRRRLRAERKGGFYS